jgi:hypothetical protein
MDTTLIYLLLVTVWLGLVAILILDKLFGKEEKPPASS